MSNELRMRKFLFWVGVLLLGALLLYVAVKVFMLLFVVFGILCVVGLFFTIVAGSIL